MAHPMLTPVVSSSLKAYRVLKTGDEPVGHATLFVQFKSGDIYMYVPRIEDCTGLENAKSKGTFINQLKKRVTGLPMSADAVSFRIQQVVATVQKVRDKRRRKFALDYAKLALRYPVLAAVF